MCFDQDKRRSLHEKRFQFPGDLVRTQSWPSFRCLVAQIWPCTVTSCENQEFCYCHILHNLLSGKFKSIS